MLSKRALPTELINADPSKRLRINLADLFLSNDVSGSRAQSLFADGVLAGADHCRDLGKAGNFGQTPGNCSRDITRKLLKRRRWPSLYYARVRLWDKQTQSRKLVWLPMFLPHELVRELAARADMEVMLNRDGMAADTQLHVTACEKELGRSRLLGIGLWGDGVPCNWDRTQSLEVFTINFPGLSGKWRDLRIPLTAVNKKFVMKQETFDDIMSVVAWSLQALAADRHPWMRHDLEPFMKLDAKRKKTAGRPIGVRAVLAEVRGDWLFCPVYLQAASAQCQAWVLLALQGDAGYHQGLRRGRPLEAAAHDALGPPGLVARARRFNVSFAGRSLHQERLLQGRLAPHCGHWHHC